MRHLAALTLQGPRGRVLGPVQTAAQASQRQPVRREVRLTASPRARAQASV
jgi:hypothetical protein